MVIFQFIYFKNFCRLSTDFSIFNIFQKFLFLFYIFQINLEKKFSNVWKKIVKNDCVIFDKNCVLTFSRLFAESNFHRNSFRSQIVFKTSSFCFFLQIRSAWIWESFIRNARNLIKFDSRINLIYNLLSQTIIIFLIKFYSNIGISVLYLMCCSVRGKFELFLRTCCKEERLCEKKGEKRRGGPKRKKSIL